MPICSAERRGTGKTTIAKIMAKAVNCEHPVDGSPCNECRHLPGHCCRQLRMNVIEIDAASNNGVDNIREIREEVSYSPTHRADTRSISSMRCICFPSVHSMHC